MSGSQSVPVSDHRKLGQRLGLYKIDDTIGLGLPLWLPNGTVVRDELEKLAVELEFRAGFQRVATPHIARVRLYEKSGHLPYFSEDMYPVMEVQENEDGDGELRAAKDAYVLRPMNCPHHHRVFAAQPRSYRDLPMRLAEYGQVYRWEASGALTGLSRVRGMCMNDGHIYCTREQMASELHAVLDMYDDVYRTLGINDCRFRLSCHDNVGGKDKYVADPVAWEWSERLLKEILTARKQKFEVAPGHAAFYGPKIDIQVITDGGSEETLSTVQIDFAQPGRLGLSYVDQGGQKATPYCIHRAPFSTHERFVAYLTELYQGAFPTWLAPMQALIIPISEKYAGYAQGIVGRLRAANVRAHMAAPDEKVSRNIRDAVEQRIPNILVVGQREQETDTVTLRRLGVKEQQAMSVSAFEQSILHTINARSPEFLVGTELEPVPT